MKEHRDKMNNKKNIRVLAMYLPQFHPIPENNEWWGEGFTEWTNIQRENIFSDGMKPLNDNYYNLLNKETVEWQTKLMNEYGVYGFCYYHYWFKGKKLLEKPAENLLNWKDIDQKFCFFWANHSWYRSWEGTKEVLIEQEYGTEEDWQNHFDYLKTFFTDKRYIKINNKPVFIIFNDFKQKDKIFEFFNNKSREAGFNGIYIIESIISNHKNISNNAEAFFLREPGLAYGIYYRRNIFVRSLLKIERIIKKVNGKRTFKMRNVKADKLFDISVKYFKNIKSNKKCYPGAFAMWDNTYRHSERGYKIYAPSQDKFVLYLKEMKELAKARNLDFLFFNAWNEWAEGMILEPSNLHGYRFLEGIKEVFGRIE